MILGILLICRGGVLLASEADELREHAQALRKKASISAEQGNNEQAERLERESAKLLEAAERLELKAKGGGDRGDRPGIDKAVHHLNERLHDLRAKEQKLRETKASEKEVAEVREQIAGTERELRQIPAYDAGHGGLVPAFRAQVERLEIAGRRIHHLRVAAENLKKAEMHDLAHKLMEQAEAMERDVHEARQRLAAEMHKGQAHHGEHGPDEMRELKDEIQRLRAEVRELRQKVEQQ
jgi:DNA repair exonuclease SbcCD ATPase subunit